MRLISPDKDLSPYTPLLGPGVFPDELSVTSGASNYCGGRTKGSLVDRYVVDNNDTREVCVSRSSGISWVVFLCGQVTEVRYVSVYVIYNVYNV